ncbi:hypothetical protein [Paraburkholderia phosphatilytica]|uniref:hypothetical protein n=1 Tax=Paraburkholderia phosphatilytica TaxID=2282883 RepID=UPI000E4F030C|nr:hypothetical protein [Paraburkholderia phosphatilytica]
MNFYQLPSGDVAGFDDPAQAPAAASEISAQQFAQIATAIVLTAAQQLAQQASALLAAGLAITSNGTPSLNGTYAVDQLSQMDIIAVETSLNAGKGFPGGVTAFNYPTEAGALNGFSEANFTDFAAAVRDFVYACKSVIAGQSTTLPANTVTIA